MKKLRLALIFLALFTPTVYSQVNLSQGLLAYYPFNGNANDASGNNLNGILINGVQSASDRYNNPNSALHFDGFSSYVQIPLNASFNPAHSLSIAMSFYPEQHGVQTLFGKIDYQKGLGTQFQIAMDFNLYPGVLFGVNPPSSACAGVPLNAAYVNTINPITLNQWYCLAVTFDNGQMSIYLNGTLIQTQTASFTTLNQCIDAGIQIGSWWVGDLQYFKGKIDELRIYNRAINQQEVNALCNLCNQPQGSLVGNAICAGGTGTLTFNATVGIPPFTVQYTDGINKYTQQGVVSGVPFQAQVNPNVTTTYVLDSVADANFCDRELGFIQGTAQIVVNPSPKGSLKANAVCVGDSTSFQFNSNVGSPPFGISYNINGNNFSKNGLQNGDSFNLPFLLNDTSTLTFNTIQDANGCITTLDTTIVLPVSPLPQGEITGGRVCEGDSVAVLFNSTNGTAPFEVVLSDGTNQTKYYNVQSGVLFNTAPLYASSTLSIISISSNNGTGCSRYNAFNSPSAIIQVDPAPKLKFDTIPPVCIQEPTFQITQVNETSGLSGNGIYIGNGVSSNGDFSPVNAGVGKHKIVYQYTASDGCIAMDSSYIIVNPTPKVNAGVDLLTCLGFPIQLNATGASTYSWSPAVGLDNPNKPNPIATIDSTTTYIVFGTDSNGCTASDAITVSVSKSGLASFAVPNAFTPNGDGLNDCFGIRKWGPVTVIEFSIFNRWGQLVFSTKNPTDCWDGTYNGKMQEVGGYPYIIKVITPCGTINKMGIVMLVR
ncbi:MAG: gliding motility-associated C-terminal domain-containing protein [Bacteroidetes bacterium]|nr:gliding motility-associated C-terminal domain-containing protein [Bacteroidota bacterium]